MKNKIIIGVVAVVVAVGLFFGGMKYGEASGKAQFGRGGSAFALQGGKGNVQFQGGAGGRGAAFGGITMGTILSKDDTSITISIPGGGSKIVFTSASTTVDTTATGTMDDLTVGANVMVQGTPNSDGSMTAKSIELRPAGQERAFGPVTTGSQTAPAQQ